MIRSERVGAVKLVFLLALSVSSSAWLRSQDGSRLMSPEELEIGKKLYNTHCRACHLPRGKSRIKRLNLSDQEWKNGTGSLEDIERVISNGIEATQMQPFKDRLDPQEIATLARYVLTFQEPDPTRAP